MKICQCFTICSWFNQCLAGIDDVVKPLKKGSNLGDELSAGQGVEVRHRRTNGRHLSAAMVENMSYNEPQVASVTEFLRMNDMLRGRRQKDEGITGERWMVYERWDTIIRSEFSAPACQRRVSSEE